jgi:hypothetical protein
LGQPFPLKAGANDCDVFRPLATLPGLLFQSVPELMEPVQCRLTVDVEPQLEAYTSLASMVAELTVLFQMALGMLHW